MILLLGKSNSQLNSKPQLTLLAEKSKSPIKVAAANYLGIDR